MLKSSLSLMINAFVHTQVKHHFLEIKKKEKWLDVKNHLHFIHPLCSRSGKSFLRCNFKDYDPKQFVSAALSCKDTSSKKPNKTLQTIKNYRNISQKTFDVPGTFGADFSLYRLSFVLQEVHYCPISYITDQ